MKTNTETGQHTDVDTYRTSTLGKWVYIEKKITVQPYIKKLNVRIDNNGIGKVWFDNVSIRKANPDEQIEIIEENAYYPFGGRHKVNNNVVSANSNSVASKFKYNGKELNDELGYNVYDFGARHYDPWGVRWLSVDPLAEEMPSWSPYTFVFNNPLRFIDPDGRYPIEILTRSYAPFKSFGPFFARYHGDDRGHSLNRNASFRTSATINYDTETYASSATGGRSLSYKMGASPEDGTYSDAYVKNRSDGSNLDVHSYGNNADQPGSWDIDQFTKLSVTIDGDIKGDHILNVAGTISGDDFPNQESLISDSEGNTLWLGNFATSGGKATGPTMNLARENEGDVHINVNININVNSDGVFQSVIQGDKTISIENWNKQFE